MDLKVKAALLSFARIDDAREHAAYGYWHRHDHMAEVWSRPGVAFAQRTVAPPAYLRARPAEARDLKGTQYFTYYLLTEPLQQILDVFSGGSRELAEAGRMKLLHSPSSAGIFRLVQAYASPRVVVSAAAVPFLPHTGVFVSVLDGIDPSAREELYRYYDEVHIPDLLSVRHVSGCYWFEAWPDAPVANVVAAPEGRLVRILFLDGDPLEMVLDLRWKAAQWQAAGRTHPIAEGVERTLAGPFQPITGSRYDWFD